MGRWLSSGSEAGSACDFMVTGRTCAVHTDRTSAQGHGEGRSDVQWAGGCRCQHCFSREAPLDCPTPHVNGANVLLLDAAPSRETQQCHQQSCSQRAARVPLQA